MANFNRANSNLTPSDIRHNMDSRLILSQDAKLLAVADPREHKRPQTQMVGVRARSSLTKPAQAANAPNQRQSHKGPDIKNQLIIKNNNQAPAASIDHSANASQSDLSMPPHLQKESSHVLSLSGAMGTT